MADYIIYYILKYWWLIVLVIVVPILLKSLNIGYRDCPYCKEKYQSGATVCPHCRKDLATKPLEQSLEAPFGNSRKISNNSLETKRFFYCPY